MFESKAKIKTKNFLKQIELLALNSTDRIVEGYQGTEKELMKGFIADASDSIEHNEWGVGLEELLINIYEIEFTIDKKAVDLAREALAECGLDYNDWVFIEELVK